MDTGNAIETEGNKIMIRKTLIALTAAAALTAGLAASAEAKTNFNIDLGINLGAPVYDSGYYGHDYYDTGYDNYDESCGWQTVKHRYWNWNHTHKIVRWSKQWVCY
jgi:hypothetical protein